MTKSLNCSFYLVVRSGHHQNSRGIVSYPPYQLQYGEYDFHFDTGREFEGRNADRGINREVHREFIQRGLIIPTTTTLKPDQYDPPREFNPRTGGSIGRRIKVNSDDYPTSNDHVHRDWMSKDWDVDYLEPKYDTGRTFEGRNVRREFTQRGVDPPTTPEVDWGSRESSATREFLPRELPNRNFVREYTVRGNMPTLRPLSMEYSTPSRDMEERLSFKERDDFSPPSSSLHGNWHSKDWDVDYSDRKYDTGRTFEGRKFEPRVFTQRGDNMVTKFKSNDFESRRSNSDRSSERKNSEPRYDTGRTFEGRVFTQRGDDFGIANKPYHLKPSKRSDGFGLRYDTGRTFEGRFFIQRGDDLDVTHKSDDLQPQKTFESDESELNTERTVVDRKFERGGGDDIETTPKQDDSDVINTERTFESRKFEHRMFTEKSDGVVTTTEQMFGRGRGDESKTQLEFDEPELRYDSGRTSEGRRFDSRPFTHGRDGIATSTEQVYDTGRSFEGRSFTREYTRRGDY